MEKKIHYCWFGGKKLPSKEKKCMKTWKKFLPDYEIVAWNEDSFDINNACPFVKEAYEKKKWAFVSDYVRIYALYNYGGIYFDTDMKVLKKFDNILEKGMFLGYEDSGFFGTAVIYVPEKHNKYMKEILDFYDSLDHFYEESIYCYANPVIISKILKKYPVTKKEKGIEVINDDVFIYPREYFFPYSYNYNEKMVTENTCMVHLFNATWVSRGEKRTIFFNRHFGMKLGGFINHRIDGIGKFRYNVKHKIYTCVHSAALTYSIYFHRQKRINKIKEALANQEEKYVAICHPEWMGVRNATYEQFGKEVLEIREQYNKKESYLIAQAIVDANKKMVLFNAYAKGWEDIMLSLKKINPDIIVKLIMHGGNALLTEEYDWDVFNRMIDLYHKNGIDELVFVKKSLYEFYKQKGYNARFLMNDIEIENPDQYKPKDKKDDGLLRIGLYSSGDRWVKNTYNQISAVSLFENAKLDVVAINEKISTIARRYDINLTGESHNIPREDLYRRMASNDINIYITFTECSPLIPLESLDLGVICVTGDNHHYFEGTELEKYLVVTKEDNIMEIYRQINYALENKEKIFELYKAWREKYKKEAKENLKELLKID